MTLAKLYMPLPAGHRGHKAAHRRWQKKDRERLTAYKRRWRARLRAAGRVPT